MSLDGSSVLVTGGTRGIGLAIALRLVRDGASRAVLGYMRNDEAAEQAAGQIRAAGAEPCSCAARSREQVVAELASHGPYQVVVRAATGVIRPALETTDHHWDWTLNANARALLANSPEPPRRRWRPARDHRDLEPRRRARAGELRARRHLEAALSGRALSRGRLAHDRVNGLGRGRRPNALEHFPNKEGAALVERTPAGRLVTAEDIAGAVSFLCSDDAAMVCGQR